MSDFTQTTFFAPKDSLITGNPAKLVKGVEVDAELAAIAVAIASKYDKTTAAANVATGKRKVTGTVRSYTITLADDPELAGITLAAGNWEIRQFLCFNGTLSGAGGIQLTQSFTGTGSFDRKIWRGYVNGADVNVINSISSSSIVTHATITTLSDANWVMIEGMFRVTVSGNFAVNWAQQSSVANGTQLNAGSYVVCQPVA